MLRNDLLLPLFLNFVFTATVKSRRMSKDECLSFERSNYVQRSSNVVNVYENEPAYLHCTVPHSNTNLVAWTRLTDDALLTAGGHSFTSDTRFQISPKREARDWVLNIRRVQPSDSGCYLCEVNTEPQSSLFTVYLNVVSREETTTVPPLGIKRTSKLTATMYDDALLLNCTVETDNHGAIDVLWTRDGRPVNLFDEKKFSTDYKILPKAVIYTLRVTEPTSEDDGTYACEGEELPRAAQIVHVNAGPTFPPFCLLIIFLTALHHFLFQ